MKEYKKADILQRLVRGNINGSDAAKLLNLSVRHIRRLRRRFEAHGPQGLAHKSRGKQGNRRIPDKERKRIVSLLNKKYSDFHPTHATEKLTEKHGIVRDPKTIRSIMIAEGLWKISKKKKDEHREWRLPKAFFGEMQQFDGSYHHWVEDRSEDKWCLLLAVDDATSAITHGRFDKDEGVLPVCHFWQEYLVLHGKPKSVYLDRFSTYKMTQQVAKDNHDTKTQFERALATMGIDPISAYSPEAKGRVENKFKTLQNRLIKEMRLRNISSIEEANIYLQQEFIPWFNEKYAKEPRRKANVHQPLTAEEKKNLPIVFSRQKERTVQNDFTISFKKQWYQITNEQRVTICKKDKVIAHEYVDGTIHFTLRGKEINILPIDKGKIPQRREIPWIIPATSPNIPTYTKVGHF